MARRRAPWRRWAGRPTRPAGFPRHRANRRRSLLGHLAGRAGQDQFGYPLTPARLERGETGVYVTQWFERARLEWHPENRGTAYEVLQGRLGATLLQGWGR